MVFIFLFAILMYTWAILSKVFHLRRDSSETLGKIIFVSAFLGLAYFLF